MSLWLFVWCLCVLVSIIMVHSSLMFGSILEEALQLCRYFVAGKNAQYLHDFTERFQGAAGVPDNAITPFFGG